MPNLDDEFETSKQKILTLKADPGDATKLKLYALFKQATIGKCDLSQPGAFDFVGKAKWKAWTKLGDISKDEAKKQYISLVNELVKLEFGIIMQNNVSSTKYQTLLVKKEDKITRIVMNRPHKKNAMSFQMFSEILQCLQEASKDDSVVIVITGAGDYFSSGNDFGNFSEGFNGDMEEAVEKGIMAFKKFISFLIDFPKPLVALVNGPAIGIAVTALALFDIVYVSDKATFHTPFSSLAISPEGCSSYLFPKLMGSAKANEILMLGKKLTATEAYERNLVTEIFPDHLFLQETNKKVEDLAKLPLKSLQNAKMVNRNLEIDLLHRVNEEECKNLKERFLSADFMNAIMNMKSRL